MKTKSIKKEIALFLLAGYETGEIIVNFIIKERTKVLAFLLMALIGVITMCKFKPELIAVYECLFIFIKWSVPTVFLSTSAVRYLLG